jgi:hypothetical protein
MDTPPASGRPPQRRRQYLIDRPTQVSVTAHVVGVLIGLGALYAVVAQLLFDVRALMTMEPERARQFMTLVHVAYVSLSGALMALTVLLLTHRFVGPAMVIRRAIEGMRQGDYGRRLTLRRRDYLKPLAQELEALRADVAGREAVRRKLLGALDRCIEARDLASAREFLDELQARTPGERPADVQSSVAPGAVRVSA